MFGLVKLEINLNRGNMNIETFKANVKTLVDAGVLVQQETLGHQKTFKEVLKAVGDVRSIDDSDYVVSKIDAKPYCLANGKFEKHLRTHNLTKLQYLKLCGFTPPIGYVVSKKEFGGKSSKEKIGKLPNGADLYFAYRAVLTSVSTSVESMMMFYGMSAEDAEKYRVARYERHAINMRGDKNHSYGRRGLNAHCYKPFAESDNPIGNMRIDTQSRISRKVLQWAADNDIDTDDMAALTEMYHSELFRKIHRAKGVEYQQAYGLDTIEQGVFKYNQEKSKAFYDPKKLFDACMAVINSTGTDADKELAKELAREGKWESIIALRYAVSGFCGYKGRTEYLSPTRGKFALRSKLEKGFLYMADRLDCVSSIFYEKTHLRYEINGELHYYYIDFDVILTDGRRVLVEVKPNSQCSIPEGIVLLKKQAAEEYARAYNCKYVFITEKDMRYNLVKDKLCR